MADVNAKTTTPSEAEKLEKFKAQKKAAAEKFRERKAQEKKDRVEGAKAVIADLKKAGFYDKLSDKSKAYLNGLANPVAMVSGGTTSTFSKIWGANPAVGAKKTLEEIFQITFKGKSEIDRYVKKWAEAGTVVTFQQNADNLLKSTYTIEKIGAPITE